MDPKIRITRRKPIRILADSWIQPNCSSQVFRLDLCRLLSILNPTSSNSAILNDDDHDDGNDKMALKLNDNNDCCVKIIANNNGKLMMLASKFSSLNNQTIDVNNNNLQDRRKIKNDSEDSWLYYVRLASNCFEQNLVAYPAQQLNDDYDYINNNNAINSSTTSISWPVFYLVTRPIEPGEELCFWPWFGLSLSLGIPPFLSLVNILNDHCYVCHQCGNCFSQPNPLKIHLVLACSKRNCSNNMSTTSNPYYPLSTSLNNKSASIGSITATATSNRIQSLINIEKQNLNSTSPSKVVASLPKKLHTCSYCGKVYTRKYGLKIHIRTHTGLKPLNCRYCGRSFSDPSNLNKHMRLHTHKHLSTTAHTFLIENINSKTTTNLTKSNDINQISCSSSSSSSSLSSTRRI